MPSTPPPRRDRLDRIALVLALVALVVLVAAVAGAFSLANAPTPEPPTPPPPPTLSIAQVTASQVAAVATNAEERALGVTLAAVMQATPGRLALGLSPTGTVLAPEDAPDFVPQNDWVGLIDGVWMTVYAGALRSDPQQGLLLLVTVTAQRVDQQRFPVMLSHGALRLSAQNVQRLIVVAPDGTTYYFDVLARRFVGSLIAYADTATPLPSLTPSATPTLTPAPTSTPSPSPTPASATATLSPSPSATPTTTP